MNTTVTTVIVCALFVLHCIYTTLLCVSLYRDLKRYKRDRED